jgi:hypothetical protein
VTLGEIEASDDRQAAIGLIQFGAYLLTFIFFIAWFHRALQAHGGSRYPLRRRLGDRSVVRADPLPVAAEADSNDIWRGSDPRAPSGRRQPGAIVRSGRC